MSAASLALVSPLAALQLARPQVLWALLLALPVVLLHLHRRRRRVVPFLPLLLEGAGPRAPAGGWRRLRDRLSLLARLLALGLVVLAWGGLAPARAGPGPRALWVVLDLDVTAATRERDGRRRVDHAFDLARAWVRAEAWREVSVLAARGSPAVLVSRETDPQAAARALEDVPAPGPETADLAACVALARDHAAAAPPAALVVLSARDLPEPPDAAGVEVQVRGVGRERENQGFADLRVAPGEDPARASLRVRIVNEAPAERSRDLVLWLDDEEVAREPVTLPAGGATDVAREVLVPPGGAWLDLGLAGPDAFPVDDALTVRLPPPLRPSVLLVHDGAARPYALAVLEAMGEGLDVAASGTVHARDLAAAPARDVVLVDGVALPAGALRPGAWLFLAPLAGDLPFEVGPALREPVVWRTAPDHPLVRDVDLAAAFVARGFPVSGPGLASLAEAGGETVVAEGERDGVRFVAIGLDPEGSDLPLRAALPLLVRNAVLGLAEAPQPALEPFYRSPGPLRPRRRLPGGPEALVRWGGREATARLAPEGETFHVPPGARGRVEVRTRSAEGPAWTGGTAFLDLDPARRVAPVREASAAPPPARRLTDETTRWRRALLATALLLLLLDLLLLAPGLARAPRRR